jgi:hypothetical protein
VSVPTRRLPSRLFLEHVQPAGSLREADELGVARQAVGADAVGAEALLHVDAARLVKVHAALLHDGENLGLGGVVETGARIAAGHVAREVKRAACEARLNVIREGTRYWRIVVQPLVQVSARARQRPLDRRLPVVAREEEDRATDQDQQGDGGE